MHKKVGALVNTPFTWLTKVSSACSEQEKLRYQVDALVAYENFLSTSQNPEKNIQAQIEGERRNTISRNREIIECCKVRPLLRKTVHCFKRAQR